MGRITHLSLAYIKLTHLPHVLIVCACCILTFEHTGARGSSLQRTVHVRSTLFSAVRDGQGRPMCISDQSDLIQPVRYKSQCMFLCQEMSTCEAVNWRMGSKSCELHFRSPTNYVAENNCYAFLNRKFDTNIHDSLIRELHGDKKSFPFPSHNVLPLPPIPR